MPNQVHTRTIGEPGLFLSAARHNHLLSGSSPDRGGTGHAWLAGELLLSALSGCAASIVTTTAVELGIRLDRQDIRSESERDADRPNHYAAVALHFELQGPTQAEGERLVREFQTLCPIYGTVSRGAPLSVTVAVVA